DGRRAAWLAWDHPRMPWDGTELMVADVGVDGTFGAASTAAGGPEESIAQAEWAPDGTLLFASDRTGWWNLYRADPERGAVALCRREEEFAGPLWKIGARWFAPLDNGLIAVVHGKGATALGILDPETGEVVDAAGPWTEWSGTLTTHGSRVVGVAASPRSAYEVVELDTSSGRARVVGATHDDPVDPAYYPEPQIRTFSGPAGRDIHAHIYPPHNPQHRAPDAELPPYVVWAHGGPTGHAPLVLDLEIAYFTSRGIGVAEVNYGGSTGYGRAYRNRLREQWGVVDVEDCAAVALALAEEGTADPARLAIRGGSAG
ncbi:prolyl oligopeptidase family serine peptidase, partial [Streptomyces sp. T-3]|nr:prolyl oligopeptidase family serine peptidase [Streptomyces sp. T-3]